MAVEAVIFDVSRTLLQMPSGARGSDFRSAQPGVIEAVGKLRTDGIQVVAAGNHMSQVLRSALSRAGVPIDLVVGRDTVGNHNKGTPHWIATIRQLTGLTSNQMMYIGDDHHDMLTALAGQVIYAHAEWVTPRGKYGLAAPKPAWVPAIVRHIFRKQHPWYWTLQTSDRRNRPVRVLALLDNHGARVPGLESAIVQAFKEDRDRPLGPMKLKEFVMLHLLASLYQSGLYGGIDFWTTYPGHDGDPNTPMESFLGVAANLFREKYRPDLISRHTPAEHSLKARESGGATGAIQNQLKTICLNPIYADSIAGKKVIIFDNFLARGFTTDAGRNLLLASGASEVIIAALVKYPGVTNVFTAPDQPWWSFIDNPPDAQACFNQPHNGQWNPAALDEFRASVAGISVERW